MTAFFLRVPVLRVFAVAVALLALFLLFLWSRHVRRVYARIRKVGFTAESPCKQCVRVKRPLSIPVAAAPTAPHAGDLHSLLRARAQRRGSRRSLGRSVLDQGECPCGVSEASPFRRHSTPLRRVFTIPYRMHLLVTGNPGCVPRSLREIRKSASSRSFSCH